MVIVLLGAGLVTLIGFAGLVVDVANGYVVRGILQHAVDDAARTAQRWSAQVDDSGVDPAAIQAQAVATGVETARHDLQTFGLAGVSVVESAVAGARLRIAARASVGTWFLRVFGIASWRPSASADVMLWAPAPAAAVSVPAGPPPALTAPSFPTSSGPLPPLVLPEGPSGGGTQREDTAPGPGPSDSGGSAGPSAGSGGGDIMEGP